MTTSTSLPSHFFPSLQPLALSETESKGDLQAVLEEKFEGLSCGDCLRFSNEPALLTGSFARWWLKLQQKFNDIDAIIFLPLKQSAVGIVHLLKKYYQIDEAAAIMCLNSLVAQDQPKTYFDYVDLHFRLYLVTCLHQAPATVPIEQLFAASQAMKKFYREAPIGDRKNCDFIQFRLQIGPHEVDLTCRWSVGDQGFGLSSFHGIGVLYQHPELSEPVQSPLYADPQGQRSPKEYAQLAFSQQFSIPDASYLMQTLKLGAPGNRKVLFGWLKCIHEGLVPEDPTSTCVQLFWQLARDLLPAHGSRFAAVTWQDEVIRTCPPELLPFLYVASLWLALHPKQLAFQKQILKLDCAADERLKGEFPEEIVERWMDAATAREFRQKIKEQLTEPAVFPDEEDFVDIDLFPDSPEGFKTLLGCAKGKVELLARWLEGKKENPHQAPLQGLSLQELLAACRQHPTPRAVGIAWAQFSKAPSLTTALEWALLLCDLPFPEEEWPKMRSELVSWLEKRPPVLSQEVQRIWAALKRWTLRAPASEQPSLHQLFFLEASKGKVAKRRTGSASSWNREANLWRFHLCRLNQLDNPQEVADSLRALCHLTPQDGSNPSCLFYWMDDATLRPLACQAFEHAWRTFPKAQLTWESLKLAAPHLLESTIKHFFNKRVCAEFEKKPIQEVFKELQAIQEWPLSPKYRLECQVKILNTWKSVDPQKREKELLEACQREHLAWVLELFFPHSTPHISETERLVAFLPVIERVVDFDWSSLLSPFLLQLSEQFKELTSKEAAIQLPRCILLLKYVPPTHPIHLDVKILEALSTDPFEILPAVDQLDLQFPLHRALIIKLLLSHFNQQLPLPPALEKQREALWRLPSSPPVIGEERQILFWQALDNSAALPPLTTSLQAIKHPQRKQLDSTPSLSSEELQLAKKLLVAFASSSTEDVPQILAMIQLMVPLLDHHLAEFLSPQLVVTLHHLAVAASKTSSSQELIRQLIQKVDRSFKEEAVHSSHEALPALLKAFTERTADAPRFFTNSAEWAQLLLWRHLLGAKEEGVRFLIEHCLDLDPKILHEPTQYSRIRMFYASLALVLDNEKSLEQLSRQSSEWLEMQLQRVITLKDSLAPSCHPELARIGCLLFRAIGHYSQRDLPVRLDLFATHILREAPESSTLLIAPTLANQLLTQLLAVKLTADQRLLRTLASCQPLREGLVTLLTLGLQLHIPSIQGTETAQQIILLKERYQPFKLLWEATCQLFHEGAKADIQPVTEEEQEFLLASAVDIIYTAKAIELHTPPRTLTLTLDCEILERLSATCGISVACKAAKQLFEPFFKSAKSTTPSPLSRWCLLFISLLDGLEGRVEEMKHFYAPIDEALQQKRYIDAIQGTEALLYILFNQAHSQLSPELPLLQTMHQGLLKRLFLLLPLISEMPAEGNRNRLLEGSCLYLSLLLQNENPIFLTQWKEEMNRALDMLNRRQKLDETIGRLLMTHIGIILFTPAIINHSMETFQTNQDTMQLTLITMIQARPYLIPHLQRMVAFRKEHPQIPFSLITEVGKIPPLVNHPVPLAYIHILELSLLFSAGTFPAGLPPPTPA